METDPTNQATINDKKPPAAFLVTRSEKLLIGRDELRGRTRQKRRDRTREKKRAPPLDAFPSPSLPLCREDLSKHFDTFVGWETTSCEQVASRRMSRHLRSTFVQSAGKHSKAQISNFFQRLSHDKRQAAGGVVCRRRVEIPDGSTDHPCIS